MIVYMLHRAGARLSIAQIMDFMLVGGYTNYLTLQEVIGDLLSQGLAEQKKEVGRTWLTLTTEGEQTIEYVTRHIRPDIAEQIDTFLSGHAQTIVNESALSCDYTQTASGNYRAILSVTERGRELVSVSVELPTEEAAIAACDRWKTESEDIYRFLLDRLMG